MYFTVLTSNFLSILESSIITMKSTSENYSQFLRIEKDSKGLHAITLTSNCLIKEKLFLASEEIETSFLCSDKILISMENCISIRDYLKCLSKNQIWLDIEESKENDIYSLIINNELKKCLNPTEPEGLPKWENIYTKIINSERKNLPLKLKYKTIELINKILNSKKCKEEMFDIEFIDEIGSVVSRFVYIKGHSENNELELIVSGYLPEKE